MAAADTCYGRGLSRSRVVADRMADLSGSSIVIGHKVKVTFFGYFSEVMLIFGVKRGFTGQLVEFGHNRQEKMG